MTRRGKYHGRECKEQETGVKWNLKTPKESAEEKDRRRVRSKLFIILAAESHLQVTVQMERVQSKTEEQHDKLHANEALPLWTHVCVCV